MAARTFENGTYFNPFVNEYDTTALNELAEKIAKPGCLAIEIGTREGYSASITAGYVELAGGGMYVVDPWEATVIYGHFKRNMKILGLTGTVIPLMMKSVVAAKFFREETFDFVFIDGDHSYEAVKEDIELWLPKLKTGAIMAGHDYNTGRRNTVVRAVKDAFGDKYEISPHSFIWHTKKR